MPTYFVVVSLAFCICLFWLVKRAEASGFERNTALDIATVLMAGGLFGSRLFHIVFEEPAYYIDSPFRVFEIWKGGFVWYGGALIGSAAALYFVSRRGIRPGRPIDRGAWLDLFAPIGALGYGVGRFACLLEGCCYGASCALPFAMNNRYPTQAFAIVWELVVVGALLGFESRRSKWLSKQPGRLFAVWMILHSIGRILMETFRDDPRGPAPLGLSLSSWISGAILVAAISFLLYAQRKSQHDPLR